MILLRSPILLVVFLGILLSPASLRAQDSTMSRLLQLDGLGEDHQRDILERSPMFVFVGCDDSIFSGTEPGSLKLITQKQASVTLHQIIQFQIKQLRAALSDYSMTRETVFQMKKRGLPMPQMLFLAISDGGGQGDSRIETFHFTWNEDGTFADVSRHTNSWQPSPTGGFVESTGESFELHLPTQVESIVRHFKDIVPDHSFDQFVYLFKAHGSKFASTKFDYDLLTLMGQQIPNHVTKNHVFLFDSHGPDASQEYSADLFLPYWTRFTGCRVLSQNPRVDQNFLAATPSACSCKSLLQERNKPVGTFSAVPEASEQSFEDLIFGDSFIFDLGSSKCLFYRSFEPIKGRAPTVKIPEGVRRVAGAVSYDMTDPPVRGLEKWALPYGKFPTLIVLDSCKGNPAVFRLIENHDTNGSWRDKIATITSSDLVSTNVWNYGALNASQYLLLADLAAWQADVQTPKEDRSSIETKLNEIEHHLTQEGLIDLNWITKCIDEENRRGDQPFFEQLKQSPEQNPNRYRFFNLNAH